MFRNVIFRMILLFVFCPVTFFQGFPQRMNSTGEGLSKSYVSSINNLSSGNEISLRYDQNNIKIDFVALSINSSSKVIYDYMLAGVDSEWHTTAGKNVQYNSIPAGTYLFKLRAHDYRGQLSDNMVELKITITPPFWKHWWFILSGTVLVLVFIIWRYRSLKNRNILLEQKVEERTQLLNRSRSLLVTELEERLTAEEALRKSHFQFSLVWENSIDGMRITDKDGIVIKVNDAFCRMVGKTKEEVEGRSFSVIYEESTHPGVLKRYQERFKNREVEPHYEREFYLWNGEKAWFEVSSSYLEHESDCFLLLIFRNVSERKFNENSLKKYASELEELNRRLAESESKLKEMNASKDKYFSIISHDLRSPFNALLGITDFLLNDLDSLTTDEIRNFAQNLYNSTRNVFHLLEDLLQWSRIQTGRIEFRPANFKLDSLLAYNISLLLGNAVKKNVEIYNEIEDTIFVYADENMIGSVFQNLLSNAIKFTRPGGYIKISSRIADNFVEISVSDNGIGIDKSLMPGLFKVDTNRSTPGTDHEKGTGLGLIICKEFIELNGGKIFVESQKEQGTTISFTIPCATD